MVIMIVLHDNFISTKISLLHLSVIYIVYFDTICNYSLNKKNSHI